MDHNVTRREAIRAGAGGVILMGTAGTLAACGSTSSKSVSSTSSPTEGGTLTVGMITGGSTETLTPGLSTTNVDLARIQNVYDRLHEVNTTGGVDPSLAASAEPSKQGTVWTVRLRDGVVWHDGSPLTADDLLYTVKTWVSPNNFGSIVAAPLFDVKRARKLDNLTVEIPCHVPVAQFREITAWPFASLVKNGAAGHNPIGTGPFRVRSFTPGAQSIFDANSRYWGPKPHVSSLVINSSFTDETGRLNSALSGAIDIIPALPFLEARTSSNSLRVEATRSSNVYSVDCRIDVGPFTDPRARLALKLLVDRTAQIESVFDGHAVPSNDLYGPGDAYFASELPVRPHDVEQARSLLKAAGQEQLTATLITSTAYPSFVESATTYAQQASQGGVNLGVKIISPSVYFTAAGGWTTRPMGMDTPGGQAYSPCLTTYYVTAFVPGGPYNDSHWGNPQYTKLVFDAIGELDPNSAKEKWFELQKQQYERGGDIMLATPDYVDGYGQHVGGIHTTFRGWCDNFNFRTAWKSA